MSSDRQKIKAIFNSALEMPDSRRAEYLAEACAGDADLQLEVENLLSSYESDFLEAPAMAGEGLSSLNVTGKMIGRYEVLSLIGSGGMGEVYLARDNKLDRKVAIKILHEKYKTQESNIRRFTQEAKAASALNHPNILVIHEIGETSDSHYIVSEYVDGKTLRDILIERRLSISETLDFSVQIAAALAAAHAAGIIHRDIKPENIVVRSDGYVKVLDFGLAKLVPSQPSFIGLEDKTVKQMQTAAGLILGTVSYMSPEQAKGETVDERTDVFSLGAVIYEMVAGTSPFAAESMTERLANLINKEPLQLGHYRNDIPRQLENIVARMLRKNRAERYGSMQGVVEDLKRANQLADVRRDTVEVQEETLLLTGAEVRPIRGRTGWMHSRLTYAVLALAVVAGLVTIFSQYNRNPVLPTNSANYSSSPGYDQFLRGKVNVTSESRDNNETAIKLLEQAVALDPNLAPAYAELARAYNIKAFYYAPESEKKKLNQDAEVAVEKALMLNPDLPEAYLARGLLLWTHSNRFPHDQAIRSYKRALSLNPNFDEAHHQLGLVYLHVGLLDEAWKEIEKSLAINPGNTMSRFRFGVIQLYRGRYDEALTFFNTTPLEKNPSLWAFQKASILFQLGRTQEAAEVVEQYLRTYSTDEGGTVTSVKALLLAKAGKELEAEEAIQHTIEIGQGFGHFHHSAYNIASSYALLNKPDQAIKWLRTAADDGLPCYPLFESDVNLNNLRHTPEFIQFMAEMRSLNDRYRNEVE